MTTEDRTTTTKKSTTTSKLGTTTTDASGNSATDAVIRQGFIEGLMKDGTITEAEANCTADWVEQNLGYAKMISGDITPEETQQIAAAVLTCKSSA